MALAELSAFGAFSSGQAQAADYTQNMRNEQQQSTIALDQSFVRAGQVADETSRAAGRQTAAYGAAGVVTSAGTPLQVLADTARKGEMARQLTLYQGRVNALSYQEQADADKAQATAAKTASYIGAATTFLDKIAQGASAAGAMPGFG